MGTKKNTRIRILGLALAALAAIQTPARASYGDASETVPLNRMTAGLHAALVTRPGIAGTASLGVGLAEWLSLHFEAGYGTTDVATNAFTGRMLLKGFVTKYFGGVDQLSLLIGAGYNKFLSVQTGLLITTSQKYYDLYTGLDASCWIARPGQGLTMQFLLGVKAKNFLETSNFRPAAVFEIGVPLTNGASFTFTLSALLFLDYKIVRGRP